MGWPPTKRGWSTDATRGPFTPPTSVTTARSFHADESKTSAMIALAAWTGVATTTRSASRSMPTSERAPIWRARAATWPTASVPVTVQPCSRNAIPTEPPMSPVPKIIARPGVVTPPPAVAPFPGSGDPASSGREIVTEPLGALEIDVVDLVPRAFRRHVEQDSDAVGHRTDDGQLACADQRDGTEPHRAGGGGRKRRVDVIGGGEEDGDEVVFGQLVTVEHLSEQRHHPVGDRLGCVLVDGGGAADCSNGWGHQAGMLVRDAGFTLPRVPVVA